MVYLQIENDKIPAGNFAFIYDVTSNEDLFFKFFDAERNLKINYKDFAHKIRVAFEAFALEEESKKRKEQEAYLFREPDSIKEEIIDEIRPSSSKLTYKNIIMSLCEGRELEFKEMLVKHSFLKTITDDDGVKKKLMSYIRFVYDFGSASTHENVTVKRGYIANKTNCIRVISSFHDFLCVYYKVDHKYDSTNTSIRDYIAVPKSTVEKIGLKLDIGKYLFIKENRGKIGYYIFSSNTEGIRETQKRDIDVISKLWDDNFDDPSNVIRQVESIEGSDGDYRFQVYSLPGRPLRLTDGFIGTLSMKDRMDIVAGLCKGVETLHTFEPPMYHRDINPDAFYIFSIKGKYKPLLAKFDCTKDMGSTYFTVFSYVVQKAISENTNLFFAPEVISPDTRMRVDWEKADIYSLAKTIIYILTGRIIDNNDELESCAGIDDELLLVLMEMMDTNPQKRPVLSDLIEAINNLSSF